MTSVPPKHVNLKPSVELKARASKIKRESSSPASSTKGAASSKSSSSSPSSPSLLGPLEEIFVILERLFASPKALSLPRGIGRALYTIYQNLKVIRLHAIGQCQFATNLNLRMLNLKRQLEDFRHQSNSSNRSDDDDGNNDNTTCSLDAKPSPQAQDEDPASALLRSSPSTTPCALKEIFPVLRQTEKVVSTLQSFVARKPRLGLALPAPVWQHLEHMPENLLLFPDHLARQLSESKTLLQRIVVLYNQLAEAHSTRGNGRRGSDNKSSSSSNKSIQSDDIASGIHAKIPASTIPSTRMSPSPKAAAIIHDDGVSFTTAVLNEMDHGGSDQKPQCHQ